MEEARRMLADCRAALDNPELEPKGPAWEKLLRDLSRAGRTLSRCEFSDDPPGTLSDPDTAPLDTFHPDI